MIELSDIGGYNGDYKDEILEWNYVEQEWLVVGQMKNSRYFHGVAEEKFDEHALTDCL